MLNSTASQNGMTCSEVMTHEKGQLSCYCVILC